jgi:hypothetical protein
MSAMPLTAAREQTSLNFRVGSFATKQAGSARHLMSAMASKRLLRARGMTRKTQSWHASSNKTPAQGRGPCI